MSCWCLLVTVILDGHEVSETERLFLLNWKAMRKARRRQQKKSLEQIPYFLSESQMTDQVYSHVSSVPVAPPTLPALPARQLPYRCKKRYRQETAIQKLPQLIHSEELPSAKQVEDNFKLPELAPYRSIISQQGHLVNKLSNHQVPEKPWRTFEVLTEQR